MTVNDASVLLYQWFSEKDSFSLKRDYAKLILISEEPEAHKAAVICALKNLESLEMLKSVTLKSSPELNGGGEEQVWVLLRKFSTMDQNVNISSHTALSVASVANAYYETIGLAQEECDILSIKENDILAIISAFNTLAQKK